MNDCLDSSGEVPCELSVVVIGKNEEQFIGQSIAAIQQSAQSYVCSEIIFVDSASTDRTVEIVKQFGVRIYQLRKNWKMTPSAGRYIGSQYARGRYVFFVDGDSIVNPMWTRHATEFLDNHPDYGGVAGYLNEAHYSLKGERIGGASNVYDQDLNQPFSDFPVLGGSALYRRQALEQVGTFNPHLPTGEEAELCLRLRRAGWKLARTNVHMATKNTENRKTFREITRRVRTSFYDYGTVIRYASSYGAGWQYAWEAVHFVVTTFIGGIGLIVAVAIAYYLQAMYLVFLALIAVVMAMVIRKKGVRPAFLSMLLRVVSTYCTIRSWLSTRVKPVEEYPKDAVRVA
jgi:glycosyltransferase involved in cell wall biosynthesis